MDGSDICRCGHDRTTHEHYRRGSDCRKCGPEACAEFRLARVLRLRARQIPRQDAQA